MHRWLLEKTRQSSAALTAAPNGITAVRGHLCAVPNQELSGAKSELQGERWAYVHLIREAANYPIIHLRLTFGLHHKACKCAYLCILISEASTNKKHEEKMHIEASKTIFLRLYQ